MPPTGPDGGARSRALHPSDGGRGRCLDRGGRSHRHRTTTVSADPCAVSSPRTVEVRGVHPIPLLFQCQAPSGFDRTLSRDWTGAVLTLPRCFQHTQKSSDHPLPDRIRPRLRAGDLRTGTDPQNNIDQARLRSSQARHRADPGGLPVLPPDRRMEPRSTPIRSTPRSDQYMAGMNGGSRSVHPDFGGAGEYGIPFVVVPGTQPRVADAVRLRRRERPRPLPDPGRRAHRVRAATATSWCSIATPACLYETLDTRRNGAGWLAGSGAVFDLRSNALRPDGWTSADAAGLPILPGLIRSTR